MLSTGKRFISVIVIVLMVATMGTTVLYDNDVHAASKKVKVVYKSNGGKFTAKKYKSKKSVTKKVSKGKKRGTGPKIKKSGYAFLGWYNKKSGGKRYKTNAKIKKKTVLYAKWVKKVKLNNESVAKIGWQASSFYEEFSDFKSAKMDGEGMNYYYSPSDNKNFLYAFSNEAKINASSSAICVGILAKVKDVVPGIKKTYSPRTFAKKVGIKKYKVSFSHLYARDEMSFNKDGHKYIIELTEKGKKVKPSAPIEAYKILKK